MSVMLVRGGRNLGTSSYFPRAALAEPEEALASFVMQYYSTQDPPPEVLVGRKLEDAESLGSGARRACESCRGGAEPVTRARCSLG